MAEVQKKIKTCPNGHPYDPTRHQSCPYCSNGGFAPTLDPFADVSFDNSGSFTPTTDPYASHKAGFAPTQDPGGSGSGSFDSTRPPDVHLSGRMSQTMYVDSSTPAGAPSPVVGWLVALDGPCRGTDYRIHVGYNYIGRNSGDICIHGDATISGERDSSVTYVPQTRGFYIAHELGKNPLLLNGKPVIREAELKNYDRITVGTTQLIFVGLSGEQFDWSEG